MVAKWRGGLGWTGGLGQGYGLDPVEQTVPWSDLRVRNIPLGMEWRVGCRLRPESEGAWEPMEQF